MTSAATCKIGIVGGSGFDAFQALEGSGSSESDTRYGKPSADLQRGRFAETDIVFLPRHGPGHTIPPHLINYRANMWALRSAGVELVISLAAVGGITELCAAGTLVIPDQILDYTYGREHTFGDSQDGPVQHFDFTYPYCDALRQHFFNAGRNQGIALIESGTYAAVQGPRFETAAEIDRLERDGADIVGMTGMPEAALARELGMCYATIALVVNRAAGRGAGEISETEINKVVTDTGSKVYRLLAALMPTLGSIRYSAPLAVSV